ncbi:hypothetical protein V5O48_015325 [Marasmius crinis-equi]|uniref:Integrase catalytic domain-containing protein n=1 Tax=Marasmius crinis-equi TaxID=585013 RepID=A0ABR3EUT8_9AGAR
MSNNPKGKNQYHNGTKPSDEVLQTKLMQYAAESLTHREMLQGLSSELDYHISDRKLSNLLRELKIPTVHLASKRMTPEMQSMLVTEKLADDPYHRKGPNTIKSLLHQEGTPLPRDVVRRIQKDTQGPMAAYNRAPGRKAGQITRTKVLLLGPFQEIHCDGHEKLYSAALDMGGVGIGIYLFRQKVGKIEMLVAVPDARRADIVGHLHLDLVEQCGYRIALQMTVDGGSETGEMYAQHTALRAIYSPQEFNDLEQWPPYVALPSTRNIIAEAMWAYMRKHTGKDLQQLIKEGASNGYFSPHNPVHRDLFHWLWSRIVQACLDKFTQYWNNHKTRANTKSDYPSGTSPNHVMRCPRDFNLRDDLGVAVDPEGVNALRGRLPPRQEMFRWTTLQEFDIRAQVVYETVANSIQPRPPKLEDGIKAALRGWEVFSHMSPLLENWYRAL